MDSAINTAAQKISDDVEADVPWLREKLDLDISPSNLTRVKHAVIVIKAWARLSTQNNLRKRLRQMGKRLVAAVRTIQRAFRAFISRRDAMLERVMLKWSNWYKRLLIEDVKNYKRETVFQIRASLQKALRECGMPYTIAMATAAAREHTLEMQLQLQQSANNIGDEKRNEGGSRRTSNNELAAEDPGKGGGSSSRHAPPLLFSPDFLSTRTGSANARRRSSGHILLNEDERPSMADHNNEHENNNGDGKGNNDSNSNKGSGSVSPTTPAVNFSPSASPVAPRLVLSSTATDADAAPDNSANTTTKRRSSATSKNDKKQSEFAGMLPSHVTATEVLKLFESTLPTTEIAVGSNGSSILTGAASPSAASSPTTTAEKIAGENNGDGKSSLAATNGDGTTTSLSSAAAASAARGEVVGTAAALLDIDYFALFDTVMTLYREYVYNKTIKRREMNLLQEVIDHDGVIVGENMDEFFGMDYEKIKRDRKIEAERQLKVLRELFTAPSTSTKPTLRIFEPSRDEIRERYLIAAFCYTVRNMGITLGGGSSRFIVAFLLKVALRTRRLHRNKIASALSLPARQMLTMFPELAKKDHWKYMDEHSTAVVPPASPQQHRASSISGGGGGPSASSVSASPSQSPTASKFIAFAEEDDAAAEPPADSTEAHEEDGKEGEPSHENGSQGPASPTTSTASGGQQRFPSLTPIAGGLPSSVASPAGSPAKKRAKKASFAPSTGSNIDSAGAGGAFGRYQESSPFWKAHYIHMVDQPFWHATISIRRPTRLLWCNQLRYYFEMKNAHRCVESEKMDAFIASNAPAAAIAHANSSVLAKRQSLAATYNASAIQQRRLSMGGGGSGPLPALSTQNLALLAAGLSIASPDGVGSPGFGSHRRSSLTSGGVGSPAAAAAMMRRLPAKNNNRFFKKSVFDVDSESSTDSDDSAVQQLKKERRETEERKRKKRFLKAMRLTQQGGGGGASIGRKLTLTATTSPTSNKPSPTTSAMSPQQANMTPTSTTEQASSSQMKKQSLELDVAFADSDADSAGTAPHDDDEHTNGVHTDNASPQKQQGGGQRSNSAVAAEEDDDEEDGSAAPSGALLTARGGGDGGGGGEPSGEATTFHRPLAALLPPPPQTTVASSSNNDMKAPSMDVVSTKEGDNDKKTEERGHGGDEHVDDHVTLAAEAALGEIITIGGKSSPPSTQKEQQRPATAGGRTYLSPIPQQQRLSATTPSPFSQSKRGGDYDSTATDSQSAATATAANLSLRRGAAKREMSRYLDRHAKILGKPTLTDLKVVSNQFVRVTCKPRDGRGVPQGTVFRPESPWGFNNDYNFVPPPSTLETITAGNLSNRASSANRNGRRAAGVGNAYAPSTSSPANTSTAAASPSPSSPPPPPARTSSALAKDRHERIFKQSFMPQRLFDRQSQQQQQQTLLLLERGAAVEVEGGDNEPHQLISLGTAVNVSGGGKMDDSNPNHSSSPPEYDSNGRRINTTSDISRKGEGSSLSSPAASALVFDVNTALIVDPLFSMAAQSLQRATPSSSKRRPINAPPPSSAGTYLMGHNASNGGRYANRDASIQPKIVASSSPNSAATANMSPLRTSSIAFSESGGGGDWGRGSHVPKSYILQGAVQSPTKLLHAIQLSRQEDDASAETEKGEQQA